MLLIILFQIPPHDIYLIIWNHYHSYQVKPKVFPHFPRTIPNTQRVTQKRLYKKEICIYIYICFRVTRSENESVASAYFLCFVNVGSKWYLTSWIRFWSFAPHFLLNTVAFQCVTRWLLAGYSWLLVRKYFNITFIVV